MPAPVRQGGTALRAGAGAPVPPLLLLTSVPSGDVVRHGRWTCRAAGVAGAPVYAFSKEDSDVISRSVYARLDVVLPGCRGVVNLCSRTACFAGVGPFEIEFVFPQQRFSPWAPTLPELETAAHGKEHFVGVPHLLHHWAQWKNPSPRSSDPLRLFLVSSLLFCHHHCCFSMFKNRT